MRVFHINAGEEEKYRFLFRIMDWDGDDKLNAEDLRRCI